MNRPIKSKTSDFEQVILLIAEARNRVYSKANAELVMLYFSVGQIVSEKVANGRWGDGTVDDLANYIAEKQPLLKGFNRRGLYRMKQFYEVYSDNEFVSAVLERQLNSVVFERTMLGNKFNSAISKQLPEGIFKDPYIFEFLALPEIHSEGDLATSID